MLLKNNGTYDVKRDTASVRAIEGYECATAGHYTSFMGVRNLESTEYSSSPVELFVH